MRHIINLPTADSHRSSQRLPRDQVMVTLAVIVPPHHRRRPPAAWTGLPGSGGRCPVLTSPGLGRLPGGLLSRYEGLWWRGRGCQWEGVCGVGGVTALQRVIPEDLRMRDRAPGDRRALGEQQRSDPHKPISPSQSHPRPQPEHRRSASTDTSQTEL